MKILSVENLYKTYPSFHLDNVSFCLEPGKITGFIGRNGAGKSTTLKSMLGLVHPDSGNISFFGKPFEGNESETKEKIGFVAGGIDCYPKKKLKTITGVTKRFYKGWDAEAYKKYMKRFALDENKTPDQLSAGMKVKYSLALALSHNASLLILDEPTSGLDPVSRDDLLDEFLALSDEGVTIFFSTHITTDLEKCADNIIYIKNGRIIESGGMNDFVAGYRVVRFDEMPGSTEGLIGIKKAKEGFTALVKSEMSSDGAAPAGLEDIMVHMEKEETK